MITNNFVSRHNGPDAAQTQKMLKVIGVASMEELIAKTVPTAIRLKKPLDLPEGMNEYEYLNHIRALGSKNKIFRTYIGQGYYNSITPAVITRNILENPGWYTSYTPYQAEISQGRLEALLNYQTLILDMTGMSLTNASLLDEATAAAEAMIMFHNARSREAIKAGANQLFVSDTLYPQTIDVLKTRASLLGIDLIFGNHETINLTPLMFGAIVQHIDTKGAVRDYTDFINKAHQAGIMVAVASDLMALALLKEPGQWGADCVFGNTQRFGLPLGFGGPSAGFFACKDDFKRQIPGRIIGITVDAQGNRALRLALQTREQHIKREKATSNICTAQALMAIMSGMYAIYHGQEGIRAIAQDIHCMTALLDRNIVKYGYKQNNKIFFDTLCIELPAGVNIEEIRQKALSAGINFNYMDSTHIGISLDETTSMDDVNEILAIFAKAAGKIAETICPCKGTCGDNKIASTVLPDQFKRSTSFLTHEVFQKYHSETDMMRYIKKLEVKDLSLNRAMIPLGSCTMKLNAAAEMMALSMPEFAAIHPFVPRDQAQGYLELIHNLNIALSEITGFAAISFQANSGAAGEYAGLTVIRRYQASKGESNRNICLIPASAHGTNPASATMAGMKVVIIKSTSEGEIDIADLKAKAEEHKANLACIMVTYPSTHGVFEEAILEIIKTVHNCGGQVYMDGANMNAQVGLTSPGYMGADVCHLNLHKTFAMPHGGGGPGVGPIGVAKHLVDFLPGHCVSPICEKHNQGAVSASPYGSAFLLPITYGYIKMLGGNGLKNATEWAILNANYLRARLAKHYKILYTGAQGMCAHEMILDCNEFSMSADVQVGDLAKRLMDYGFHAPTVAFPVHGTLMVEPTESEPLFELDRLVDAFISIRAEIAEIESGKADKTINLIKNAPHTMQVVCADTWDKPYTRQQAAFPQVYDDKYWPTVGRVDDAYGDRNLTCCCN
ncbi:MAG: aminomethyl-transferring glycine dehydrogenase [Bacteroidales bacterium]